MAGHTNFEVLRAKMTPQQRKASARKLVELKAEMLLAELRKHSGMTQQELANILGIKQPTLSAREKQDDMEIGTLKSMIEAMGGHLEINAIMPGGTIHLKQFT